MSRQAEQRIVHFVQLAGAAPDDDVAGEVAAALGARPGRTPISQRAVPTDVVAGIAAPSVPARRCWCWTTASMSCAAPPSWCARWCR